MFATPRPVPKTRVPLIGAAVVLLAAIPVLLVGHWRLGAWALAAVLWVVHQASGMVLQRLPLGMGNLASAGVVAFGRMLRAILVMVILIAVASSDSGLGLTAAIVFASAYTVEFGLSLIAFFGGEAGS